MVWTKLEFGGLIDCIVGPKYKNSGFVILATLLVSVEPQCLTSNYVDPRSSMGPNEPVTI